MDPTVDITNLKSCLFSAGIRDQTAGLEEAKKVIDSIVAAAVRGFDSASNKFIYGDWLSRLGPVILPQLEKLYFSTQSGETKTNAAIMLLYFGSKVGLSDVMAALTIDNPNQFFAASKLANAGVTEAVEPIMNLLKAHVYTKPLDQEEQASKIHSLLSALEKLGVGMPDDIKKLLTSTGVSKYVSALVTEPHS